MGISAQIQSIEEIVRWQIKLTKYNVANRPEYIGSRGSWCSVTLSDNFHHWKINMVCTWSWIYRILFASSVKFKDHSPKYLESHLRLNSIFNEHIFILLLSGSWIATRIFIWEMEAAEHQLHMYCLSVVFLHVTLRFMFLHLDIWQASSIWFDKFLDFVDMNLIFKVKIRTIGIPHARLSTLSKQTRGAPLLHCLSKLTQNIGWVVRARGSHSNEKPHSSEQVIRRSKGNCQSEWRMDYCSNQESQFSSKPRKKKRNVSGYLCTSFFYVIRIY